MSYDIPPYCQDCGVSAWAFDLGGDRPVHEDFYVHDELWDAVCPDDRRAERTIDGGTREPAEGEGGGFVLCIGCFERRLGRRLNRADFKGPPLRELLGSEYRPSGRFLDRWGAQP